VVAASNEFQPPHSNTRFQFLHDKQTNVVAQFMPPDAILTPGKEGLPRWMQAGPIEALTVLCC